MSNDSLYKTDYARSDCAIGCVHIGYGAFHRAHQALYLDDYMQVSGDLRWGIAAVNLRESESEAFAKLAQADQGYVVKSIAPDSSVSHRLVRSHIHFVDAASAREKAYDLFCLPSVHMASITVTESGYYFDPNWQLDLTAEPVAAGLAGHPAQTIYAFLAGALARRANDLNKPMTIFCCDNIRSNGQILEQALLAYIEAQQNHQLADWVRKNVSFPCSMVDRITPRTTAELEAEITASFPEYACAPVHAEDFSQWVIEDDFSADLPDFEQVGVQIVPDVEPYEEAKIRILNGGHSGLAYLGALAGHQTFDQAMRDPVLRAHFDKWEQHEVLQGLDDHIPFNTSDYLHKIAGRFENQGIADHLERICMDGYAKMAIYIRPTLEACLQKGILPEAGFDCVASWIVSARHFQNGSVGFPYHEPHWDRLVSMIEPGKEAEIASDPQIWGDLPERFEHFVPGLVAAIQRMDQKWQA